MILVRRLDFYLLYKWSYVVRILTNEKKHNTRQKKSNGNQALYFIN